MITKENSGMRPGERRSVSDYVRKWAFISPTVPQQIAAVSTGIRGLDDAIGIGGLPKGRITHLYGMKGSLKTTVALTAAASVQRSGGMVAFFDADRRFAPAYAEHLGVRVDDLLFYQPNTAEQAFDAVCALIRTETEVLIILDTIAGLIPKSELENSIGPAPSYVNLLRQAMRKIAVLASSSGSTVLILNHLVNRAVGSVFSGPKAYGHRPIEQYAAVSIRATANGVTGAFDPHNSPVRSNVIARRAKLEVLWSSVSASGGIAEWTCPILTTSQHLDQLCAKRMSVVCA
jgi:protein RecA